MRTLIALALLAAPAARAQSALDNLNVWGYGELYFSDPIHQTSRAEADLRRAVVGVGYRFSPQVTFNSEYEVEHAVASASDAGEVDVEQFYLDFQVLEHVTFTAGEFLIPFGLLNEHHEPTQFYGVQRNFVETLIIPSTWREGGLSARGDFDFGLSWNAGLVTGFDLGKWNFAPEYPLYLTALDLEASETAPLQAVHQEMSFAHASHFSEYLSLNYHGVAGLLVGASATTGNAAKVPAPASAPIPGDERVSLWEGHIRYNPGRLDLSALYAGGQITNTALANESNPGTPNPIPAAFYGYYFQAAFRVWQNDTFRFTPFVRYEYYNMGSRYEGASGAQLPSGVLPVSGTPGDLGVWPRNYDKVWTFGMNVQVASGVVLKADYQWFAVNNGFSRVDLGVGLAF